MGDMAEVFNAYREVKKAKRARNIEQSTALLNMAGVFFDSKNAGAHLVVWAGNYDVDFWPSTGLWVVRGGDGQRRRGVRKLIDFVEQQRNAK